MSGKLDGRNRDEDEDLNENIGEVMRTPRCRFESRLGDKALLILKPLSRTQS